MKIYGDIFLNGVKQTTKDIFDLNVEHSFTPNNLWYIIFNEGTTSKKKLNYKRWRNRRRRTKRFLANECEIQ